MGKRGVGGVVLKNTVCKYIYFYIAIFLRSLPRVECMQKETVNGVWKAYLIPAFFFCLREPR